MPSNNLLDINNLNEGIQMDTDRPNREFDAWIAENVMGWTCSVVGNYPWQMRPPGGTLRVQCVPHYTADIAAAWKVVEVLTRARTHDFAINRLCRQFGDREYVASFVEGRAWLTARNSSAPLAICQAAYAALTSTTND